MFAKILKRMRLNAQLEKINSQCRNLNSDFVHINSVYAKYVDDDGKVTDTIQYEMFVNGYGKRKVITNSTLHEYDKKLGREYTHKAYVQFVKPWLLGSLGKMPADRTWKRHDTFNFYYEHYVYNGEIFKRKVVVKSPEEDIVETVTVYKK